MTTTVAAPAPSAPAAPPSGDSVSVSVRQHSRPERASRSEREAKAGLDPRARGARDPDTLDEVRAKLAGDDGPDDLDDVDVGAAPDAVDDPDATEGGEEAAPEAAEVAELRGQLQEAQAHVEEVRTAATATLRENQRLERYVDFLKEAIASFRMPDGSTVELDPRELELFELRTEKELGAHAGELTAKQQEAAYEKQVTAETKRMRAEIDGEAKKAGVDAEDLAKRYAFAVMHHDGRGPEPTIADVVAEMRALADHRQRSTSAGAPRLNGRRRTSTAAVPKHPRTFAGARQFLQSQGFADD